MSAQPTSSSGDQREALGRRVREVWVGWATRQPDPKPHWLTGWDELDDGQREVDMRIGAALWGDGFAAGIDAASTFPKPPPSFVCAICPSTKPHGHGEAS